MAKYSHSTEQGDATVADGKAISVTAAFSLMRRLEIMLAELESSPLVTILVPSKRGQNPWDQIRVNISVNPLWYRSLCAANASKRGVRRGRFDTVIRRRETLAALNRLIEKRAKGTIYEERLLEAAKGIKI